MIDYLEKIGNFNANYIDSIFSVEGYHDLYNFSSTELALDKSLIRVRQLQGRPTGDGTTRWYEFLFIPNSGFLNSNLPLMPNCELKLSFDRLDGDVAMLEYGGAIDTPIKGSPIQIKDCVAITEWVSSEKLEQHFMKIDTSPMPYHYEDCDVTLKNLPLNETNIHLDNIKGGNTPLCMFAAVIPSSSLNGDTTKSSTAFSCHNVTNMCITLNGNPVNGYPIAIKNSSPVLPYHKLMDVTSRYMNPICGDGLKLTQFLHNWIYAHKFEAEASSQGWIGVNMTLSEAYTEPHTLVIWCINDCAITIDKFHQIEKLSL